MSNGGRLPALDSDFQNASLATMYDLKGSFDMQPDRAVTHETGNMSCFWVSGLEHRLGMGMVYASELSHKNGNCIFESIAYIVCLFFFVL